MCATDLDAYSLINPVTADPAARRIHQSPTYCVRGIDGSLPTCKWRELEEPGSNYPTELKTAAC